MALRRDRVPIDDGLPQQALGRAVKPRVILHQHQQVVADIEEQRFDVALQGVGWDDPFPSLFGQ